MKKALTRLLAVGIGLCIALTGCTFPWQDSGGGFGGSGTITNRRRLVNFGDIVYTRPDVDNLRALILESAEKTREANSFEESFYASMLADEAWEEMSTMYSYVNIQTYLNVNDEYYEEEYRFLDEAYVELSILNDELIRAMVEGPWAEDYRAYYGDFLFKTLETSLLLSSPDIEALKQERGSLELDYSKLLTNLTLEYDGLYLTMDEILQQEDIQTRLLLYTEYYRANAPEFTEIYARLIELDKQQAEILGFDSPADMYYLSYGRDYTPADAMQLAQSIRTELGGMVGQVMLYSYASISLPYNASITAIAKIMDSIDPELTRAWNDMMEYELYDYSASPDKMDVGFTTYLSAYDAPFTYVYWEEDFSSANTIIHEFGHFFDYWLHFDVSTANNLDTAETYSQGMEILAHEYYSELTSKAETAALNNLGRFLESITYQALLEEFQLRAYELDAVTTEALAALYTQLQEDYGFGDYAYTSMDGYDHSWFRITHLFEVPFYTISYSTSAMVALQLYSMEHDEAVNTYMRMIHANQNQDFVALIESVGFTSPFEPETMDDIVDIYTSNYRLRRAAA